MPLYEYECTKCGRRHERIEKVSGPHLKRCPDCKGKVERTLAPPAIQFKCSGWYVTDYAGKGAHKESKEAKESKDSKEASSPKESKKSHKEK